MLKYKISESVTEDANQTSEYSATVTSTGNSVNSTGTTVTVTIENNAGSTLPITGGMSTTILYIIDAILVIGATVILMTRRRMTNR